MDDIDISLTDWSWCLEHCKNIVQSSGRKALHNMIRCIQLYQIFWKNSIELLNNDNGTVKYKCKIIKYTCVIDF